jgi:hypothetical protein
MWVSPSGEDAMVVITQVRTVFRIVMVLHSMAQRSFLTQGPQVWAEPVTGRVFVTALNFILRAETVYMQNIVTTMAFSTAIILAFTLHWSQFNRKRQKR